MDKRTLEMAAKAANFDTSAPTEGLDMPTYKVTKTFKYTKDMEIEAASKAEAEKKAMNTSFDDCPKRDEWVYNCEAEEVESD